VRKLLPIIVFAVACGAVPSLEFAWGHEGHEAIALIAEHYMTSAALAKASDLLGGASMASVASWADDYRHRHPETGPWHYIDIPLASSKIEMARDCPNIQCGIAQTEHCLLILRDPNADKAAKAEALKFVIHFVGDLHQPLHNGDKGGNTRHVVFDGKPDNLHWIWDTGLLEHINPEPQALAEELERNITPLEKAEWEKGSIEDWVLEGHKLAQSVTYGDLTSADPAPITSDYERQADPAIEIQLEKAGIRLADLLNESFK
jgi:hypothetical protein